MADQNLLQEFDAADFVNLALSSRSSTFGRLALLADLRDHDIEPLSDYLYGKACIDAALQQKHGDMFLAWLSLSEAAQLNEVAEYLGDQAGNQAGATTELVDRWVEEKLYERLRPAEAHDPERERFSGGLQAILNLLQLKFSSLGGNNRA